MNQADLSKFDVTQLNRELDKTKSSVFLGTNAAFYGSLMASLEFVWSDSISTAATNGLKLWWNPTWFQGLPPETRKTVLLHEIQHVARLHMMRMGARDPQKWNQACDIRINNDLENDKYSFSGTQPCKDHDYDVAGILAAEEDIYDQLVSDNNPPPPNMWDPGNGTIELDMAPLTPDQKHQVVTNVVAAVQRAKVSGSGAGSIPGGVEELLQDFLKPIIPWEAALWRFFTQLCDEDYNWHRPNRRYSDMYLPSRFTDDGRLENLAYYLDVSGSITDEQVLRFTSEVRHIKKTYNPAVLTVVQFNTQITNIKVFKDEDPFEDILVVGRGGTSLVCVREHMIETKPTAAIVFSDLDCSAMEPLPRNVEEIPTIWVTVGNQSATVPFGEQIHID